MTGSEPTHPYIHDHQNEHEQRRLVAAFARMYSDAKLIFALRVGGVLVLACCLVVAGIVVPEARLAIGGVGGVALLVISLVVGNVERAQRTCAAATQEVFDTKVFVLPWNHIQVDRPSASRIQHAADRYSGARDSDWYDPTGGTHRPFDVLICQSANFGWGTTIHRRWAWTLTVTGLGLVALLLLGATLVGSSYGEGLLVVAAPFVAVLKELIEQTKANFEASATKEKAERQLADLWAAGIHGSRIPSETDLRALQDKILNLRQSNPYVPDWFDNRYRDTSEAAMRATTDARVAEALAAGHADPIPPTSRNVGGAP